jgi:leucyl/phenylalanyl-tRNA---protein transferase
MPIYRLPKEFAFPPATEADEDGMLAIGGDLKPERLLLAYSQGIFPWPHEGFPMLWFSPDPRMVLPIHELKVPRSLRQTMRKGVYEVRFDTAFQEVMRGCARAKRNGQRGTWITSEMADAYTRLHELGFAHSVESWVGDELAGGLYGVSLGGAFFGESMFAKQPDASKAAFVTLVNRLAEWDFDFVDAQVYTHHLERFGAREIPRDEYMAWLAETLEKPTRKGPWH